MESSSFLDSTRRRYMLRRTLFPWKAGETIDETAGFAARFGIDEIVWKIDTEEFSHGLPTLERIATYLPWLEESRKKLAAAGIAMSINPWVTVGMRDAGWDLRRTFPDFDWLTDIDGTQTKSQACPLNPAFREWLATAYEMYAGTRPRVLWIEDDIRAQNHRPARYTCFCDRHLEKFSEFTGQTWTRDRLRKEILRPGDPSPIRNQWIDFVGNGIAEVIELIASRSRAKTPATQLALMCSTPAMHATEHRDWDRIMKAVAGKFPFVVIRPCMGNYSETSPQGLYDSRERISSTLKCVRLPFHSCTEIENWPFSRFSKSVRFTRAQILLSAATRNQSMTFNLYDHLGTAIAEEPQYLEMMRDVRPLTDALVEACPPEARELGIGLLHPEDGPRHTRLETGAEFGQISMGQEPWAMGLQALGLSVTWQKSPVVAVTGQKLRAYSAALDEIFSGGVLLDLSALETLRQMGRAGELAGVDCGESFRRIERETPAEKLSHPDFGGDVERYLTVDHIPLRVRIGELKPAPGARVISEFVDPDRQPVLPGVVLFENSLGGRVAVIPYDLSEGIRPWFLNWHRQRQLFAVAKWLFHDKLPLRIMGAAYPLAISTRTKHHHVMSLLNLSQDPWSTVDFELVTNDEPREVQRLQTDGTWSSVPSITSSFTDGKFRMKDPVSVNPLDLVAYRFRF